MELLKVQNIYKKFHQRSGLLEKMSRDIVAVDNISFSIGSGEILGVVGESGCGKSTLARCITRLVNVDHGRIWFDSHDITNLKQADLKEVRANLQMIFQNSLSALNPNMSVEQVIFEPFYIHNIIEINEILPKVKHIFLRVDLSLKLLKKKTYELSGGQKQRLGIARALCLQPKLIVADEPVSSLDARIQRQIIDIIIELKKDSNMSFLFISHNLALVELVSDRIAVMHQGRIVEMDHTNDLIDNPQHSFTKKLLSSCSKRIMSNKSLSNLNPSLSNSR